jgi:hypothetical protein
MVGWEGFRKKLVSGRLPKFMVGLGPLGPSSQGQVGQVEGVARRGDQSLRMRL